MHFGLIATVGDASPLDCPEPPKPSQGERTSRGSEARRKPLTLKWSVLRGFHLFYYPIRTGEAFVCPLFLGDGVSPRALISGLSIPAYMTLKGSII